MLVEVLCGTKVCRCGSKVKMEEQRCAVVNLVDQVLPQNWAWVFTYINLTPFRTMKFHLLVAGVAGRVASATHTHEKDRTFGEV